MFNKWILGSYQTGKRLKLRKTVMCTCSNSVVFVCLFVWVCVCCVCGCWTHLVAKHPTNSNNSESFLISVSFSSCRCVSESACEAVCEECMWECVWDCMCQCMWECLWDCMWECMWECMWVCTWACVCEFERVCVCVSLHCWELLRKSRFPRTDTCILCCR